MAEPKRIQSRMAGDGVGSIVLAIAAFEDRYYVSTGFRDAPDERYQTHTSAPLDVETALAFADVQWERLLTRIRVWN